MTSSHLIEDGKTKSPDTGPDASPVGRIKFLKIDDARNERLATPRA
jgi:hypothetical protein